MRLSLGGYAQVVMTDRWFQELRAGRAFAGTGAPGAVAGQYSHVQLINPVGSGVQAIVAQVEVMMAVAAVVLVTYYDVALTLSAAVTNLLAGGAAGKAEVRTATNVAQLGNLIYTKYIEANKTTPVWPSWGPELPPGKGIAVLPQIVNTDVRVGYLVNEV